MVELEQFLLPLLPLLIRTRTALNTDIFTPQDINVVKNVKTHHFRIMLTEHITVMSQTFPSIIRIISKRITRLHPLEPWFCLDCQLFKNEANTLKQATLSFVLRRHGTAGVSLSWRVNETPTIQ